MKNKKVLVVLGGTSGEREVSLDTGKACIKALKKLGYDVSVFDPIAEKENLDLSSEVKILDSLPKINFSHTLLQNNLFY